MSKKAELISPETLTKVAEKALQAAKEQGMQQAQVSLSSSVGRSVTVRQQALESVELHKDQSLVVTVFNDHKMGSASSADFTDDGVLSSVAAAASIARQTAADDCIGLADANLMATEHPDLDIYHEWEIDMPTMNALAAECEQAALDVDKAITNTEGGTVNSHIGVSLYANSHGFVGLQDGSRHGVSCSVIAEQAGDMQRDYWYASDCDAKNMQSASAIGRIAGERTLRRLGAKQVATCEVPVIFEASIAGSIVSHLISAIKGGSIYKKASFLVDHLGEQILPEWLSVLEQPHKLRGSNSAAFDSEGVATPKQRRIVDEGVLKNYVLGSYTARKLGLQTTANGGGVHNVSLESDNASQSFEEMLQQCGTGLLVTELIGSGINMVTGDYSRGACGFWIENGKIQHPVQEVTIAGNLRDMFQSISTIGSDIDTRGNIQTGSILLDKLTVAGS